VRPTVKIEGLKELDAALGELKKTTARTVVLRALRKAGQPMADLAMQLAPKSDYAGMGKVNHNIIVSAKLKNEAGNAAYHAALKSGLGKGRAVSAMRDARRAATGGAFAVVYVGPKAGRASKVATLQEFGVGPHEIKPKVGKAFGRLSFTDGGQRFTPKIVQHPGHAPHPFMRPAFEESKGEAFNLIKVELTAELARAAERARRKALRQKA